VAPDIAGNISFGLGRMNDEKGGHELLAADVTWDASGTTDHREMAPGALRRCP